MFSSKIAMAFVAASLVALPAQRVSADAGDVAAGLLLGVIGSAAVNSNKKKKKVVYVNSAQRAETREIQTSLNYFGFPAGTPDGVSGRKTRTAISNVQAFLGYPATGQLTEFEKQFLVGSYHRAVAGGAATVQLAAASPLGMRGLLKSYQQEAAGLSAPTTGTLAVAPQQATPGNNTVIVVAPEGTGTQSATTLVAGGQVTGQAAGALPSFMAQSEDAASLASHCNKVSLITNTNGGFVTEASMGDANFALAEQFCLARTYAIATGEDLAAKVQGFTSEQIAQQCEAFGPALKDQVSALSLKPQAEVLQSVGGFVLQSGMSPAQLTGTAKICLSVGYRTDNMDVALGSALLLAALGEPVYGELMGHHLSQGFGANKRADLSLAWYQTSLDALDRGAQAVFAPAQPERSGLIRRASLQLNGQGGQLVMPQPAAAEGKTLPSFGFKN